MLAVLINDSFNLFILISAGMLIIWIDSCKIIMFSGFQYEQQTEKEKLAKQTQELDEQWKTLMHIMSESKVRQSKTTANVKKSVCLCVSVYVSPSFLSKWLHLARLKLVLACNVSQGI